MTSSDRFLDDLPSLDLPQSGKSKRVSPALIRKDAEGGGANQGETDSPAYPVIIYSKIKCPRCKSEKCPVTSTMGKIRYHKCLECKLNFKSIER
jgi:hypothetical protein